MPETKLCVDCETEKPLSEFYGNGYGQKRCKVCTRAFVKSYRAERREQYSEYERRRFKDPKRKAYIREYQRKRRAKNPEKYRANNIVSHAIRRGKLERQPCEVCGDPKSQAHHDDYSKPLEIRWLCFKHHQELHGQVVVTSNPDYNSVPKQDEIGDTIQE